MKRTIYLVLLFLCTIVTASQAALTDQIKKDFTPLEGVIIMPIGNEYLVDLDVTSGIKQGDILTLVAEGEKVIHPVTKEILGTIDIPQGYLQATQVKSGYSYAKLLTPESVPAKGDRIKRFEQVPATIDGSVPQQLAKELMTGLPQLDWQQTTEAATPLVVFSFANNMLSVAGPDQIAMKQYSYTNGSLSATTNGASEVPQDPFSLNSTKQKDKTLLNKTVDSLLSSVGIGDSDDRLESPGIIRTRATNSNIWMAPPLEGNPVGISVADFDGDSRLETAVAFRNEVLIARIDQDGLKQVAKVGFPAGTDLLSLDHLDLDDDGFPEIILSAVDGTKVSSQILAYRNGSYERIISGIDWFLRVVDMPDKGKILVGQLLENPEAPFSSPVYQLVRENNSLKSVYRLDLPSNINVFSFVPFLDDDGKLLYAYISTGDFFNIATPDGNKLWESSELFGGSETSFYTSREMNTELLKPTYIQQRLLRLPGGEILTAQNDGWRTFQNYRNFDKSRVLALSWNGFAPQEVWRTSEQGGYLGDFTVADADNDGQAELVMVMEFKKGTFMEKGRSTIVIYEMSQ